MDQQSIAMISKRIDRLEKENRRWRWAASGALAALMVLLLVGAGGSVTGMIRVRGLALVDAKGVDRAVIAMSSEGSPTLVLHDADGKRRLALGVTLKNYRGVPEVWLADENGDLIWKKRK